MYESKSKNHRCVIQCRFDLDKFAFNRRIGWLGIDYGDTQADTMLLICVNFIAVAELV